MVYCADINFLPLWWCGLIDGVNKDLISWLTWNWLSTSLSWNKKKSGAYYTDCFLCIICPLYWDAFMCHKCSFMCPIWVCWYSMKQTTSGTDSSSTTTNDEARAWLDLDLKIKICWNENAPPQLLWQITEHKLPPPRYQAINTCQTCHRTIFDSTGCLSFSRKQSSVQSKVQVHDWHAVR